ncbi:DMT family transporter [Oceaniglobus roseus]|uniref:DMT family transporter n=1 Tax=Oceaniglobus roseus TaxID=1737570 RepID=UPI000C7E954E|nr:DMT family transporter [Kandeliimicrobium roseum]
MSGVIARANEDRAGLGIAMMLVSYMFMASVDTSVKWLVIGGLHAFQLAFVRYAGALVISLVDIGRGGLSRDRFATDQFGLVLLRSLLLAASSVFNFIALKYLPLSLTSAIMFSSPIIVCALSVPLLGEKVGVWRWGAILLGFFGVLVVIRPFGVAFHWATILPMGNAVAIALYSILTRRLAGQVATQTLQFYAALTGTVVLLVPAVLVWQSPDSALDWVLMLMLGVWAWFGHELLTRAHGFASSTTLMPFTYSFMIYLTISGYLVFGDVPDSFTLLGAAIIMVSGLIIWARERGRGGVVARMRV